MSSEALCHKELFRIIGETLSEMPALQQEVFLDIHMEGQTYLEVAKARNITKRVVEYQLRKAEKDYRLQFTADVRLEWIFNRFFHILVKLETGEGWAAMPGLHCFYIGLFLFI